MPSPGERLADDPERLRESIVNPQGLRDPEDPPPTATVESPCCGRRVAGDMVLYIPGEGWLCDGCRSHLRRDDSTPWTKAKLMRVIGADPATVRKEHVKERARERWNEAMKPDEPINRREILDAVEAEVPPASEGYPPGTDPPGRE